MGAGNRTGATGSSPQRVQIGTAPNDTAPLSDIRKTFRSAYVFELQDLREPQPIMVHVLALNPSRYTLSEPYQHTLTPTEDDTVIAEENGIIVRDISLEGTPGLRKKRGVAFSGDQGELTGNEHFKHLRDMFRCYSRLKKNPRDAAHIRMIFHSLRDDDHFVIVPETFVTPRDARTTRLHYSYSITAKAIGEADNNLVALDLDKGFDFFSTELAAIGGFFNDARAAFAEITAEISKVQRKVANIQAVMIQAGGFINSVGNAFRAVGNLINFPLLLVASIAEQVDNAADLMGGDITSDIDQRLSRSLRRLSQAFDGMAASPARFGPDPLAEIVTRYAGERSLTATDIADGTGGATIGSRARTVVGTGSSSGLDLPPFGSVRRETLSRTDSIDGLAGRFSTSPELIILINDLRFPYIAAGGGPGILAPGDIILIPVSDTLGGAGVPPEDEYLTADEVLYGIDFALDPVELKNNRLELRVDETRDSLDAQLSRGLNNVIQGVEIIVRTERGATIYVPEVGIKRSVGIKGTVEHLLLAALYLREGILADPRVEGIRDSTIVLEGDVLSQEITPQLITEKDGVTLVLPFGRASGGG